MYERKFTLIHVINNFPELKEECGQEEVHFGVPWKLVVRRDGKWLAIFLHCQKQTDPNNPWSIDIDCTASLVTTTTDGDLPRKELNHKFEQKEGWGWSEFHAWQDVVEKHMDDGSVIVNCDVIVNSIRVLPKRKLHFDKPKKNLTDVALAVDDRKFHVSKVYLATFSPFFETLFFGQFSETNKSEVRLNDVDAEDFHSLIEIIYGKSNLTAETVLGVAKLSDMFDVRKAREECENFLIETKKIGRREKLRLADAFNLETLKKKCLEKIYSLSDLKDAVPHNIGDLTHSTLTALLQKCLFQFSS